MADDKTMTVEEALRRVEALKKDVEYVNGLEKKWRDQKMARFDQGIGCAW